MRFGTKTTDKRNTTSSNSGGRFIKYFRKGETRVRFLQEMDPGQDEFGGWTIFYDHFNQSLNRSFPCTGDRSTCPGCTSSNPKEQSASKRYLVNLLRQDGDGAGYVDLWKIPVSIIDDLIRYADKAGGTITDRDYTVVQFKGEDDRVKYSVDREDKDGLDLEQYYEKFQDHESALIAAYEEVNGKAPDDTGEENQDVAPAPVAQKPASSGLDEFNGPERVDPWRQDDTDQAAKDKRDDLPPTEPVAESESDGEQEEGTLELTENQLRSMKADEIKRLFANCSLPVPDSDDAEFLADELIAALATD